MSNHNEVCPICKSSNVLTDLESGEIVCSNCGTVISDKIQENKELRTFFNTEQANIQPVPPLYSGFHLCKQIYPTQDSIGLQSNLLHAPAHQWRLYNDRN